MCRCKLTENDFEEIASGRFKNLQELVLLENDNRFGDKEESKRGKTTAALQNNHLVINSSLLCKNTVYEVSHLISLN